MVTINDVAKAAQVSTATVSRVVNNGPKVGAKTRQRVLDVMEQLGYRPNANARALASQRSTTLGVVIPELTDPFFASLANGVEVVARNNGMQLLLSTGLQSAETERQAIQLLIEQRCEALVVHSKKLDDATLLEFASQVPGLILIDRYIPAIKNRCIWLDNMEGGRIAARYLLSLQHTQIACINSLHEIDDPRLRQEGFEQILSESGHPLSDQLTVRNEPTLKGGELAAQQLLARDTPFSCVFAYNDAMAIGAISVFEDNGFKVPGDISVVGFDDVLISRYSRPKLTTLHYPIQEMAESAATLALQFNGSESTESTKCKYIPTLVKRESVSPEQA
ncbi:LacI family DNA-binding transcriptional regulator [Microbulbifer agarilyticus]|uniref:LacI family DNA-binding transcriptional regulator n=1 Tax=Microbulbifer agarilyticus TaxID=260552 RepID=UPI001CD411D2|nr:LacI family DNA-binding transcriptional regulator [Microbulbifer agarilyticus]MCA0900781.1 LacI family DNA-binding transcriptional regulator [Microbulbifer agarilyticus]